MTFNAAFSNIGNSFFKMNFAALIKGYVSINKKEYSKKNIFSRIKLTVVFNANVSNLYDKYENKTEITNV